MAASHLRNEIRPFPFASGVRQLHLGLRLELVEALLQKGDGQRIGGLQALHVLDLVGQILLQKWEGVHRGILIFLQTRVWSKCWFFAPQCRLQSIDFVG